MHKTVHALLALSSAAILASPALATNFVSEPFSYLNGNLVPNGGWATSSGIGTDIQVIGNYAEGDMNQVRADELAFPAQGLTGVTYSSFRVRILQPVSGVPRRNYFAHMKDTGTSNARAKIWVMGAGSSTTTFYFGVSVAGTHPATLRVSAATTRGTRSSRSMTRRPRRFQCGWTQSTSRAATCRCMSPPPRPSMSRPSPCGRATPGPGWRGSSTSMTWVSERPSRTLFPSSRYRRKIPLGAGSRRSTNWHGVPVPDPSRILEQATIKEIPP